MQVIKCRVWIDGELLPVDVLEFKNGVLTHIAAGDKDVWHADVALKMGVIKLDRYTGKPDIDGNDICEGDIIENERGERSQVTYQPIIAMFLTGTSEFGSVSAGKELRVIGNIHQNLNLLEM